MKIGEFEVEVERKKIKNLHLAVYPPDGRVHISVPEHLTDWDISTFLYSKLGWIRRQYEEVISQNRQSEREFVTGESHYLFGERYLLEVIPTNGTPKVECIPSGINLYVKGRTSKSDRSSLLYTFYRNQLSKELVAMMQKWLERMGEMSIPVTHEIDMVLRKWGQCYKSQRRIVFSLLLARVPLRCIEYVVVHEIAHLKVHEHNADFIRILDTHLPDWRSRKQELDNFISLALPHS